MAEVRNLLSFMDEEDRARALRRIDAQFEAAGPEGEEDLIASFGTPIRHVLALEREYRQALKDGAVPFADTPRAEPVPAPHPAAEPVEEESAPVEEESVPAVPESAPDEEEIIPPAPDEDLTAQLRAAAEFLDTTPDDEPGEEAIPEEDDQLPIEGFPLFPEEPGEEPERFDWGDVPAEAKALVSVPEEDGEQPEETEGEPAEPEEEPLPAGEPETEEPVFVEVPVDPGEDKVSVLSEQIDLIAYEPPEQVLQEAVPIHDMDESAEMPPAVPVKRVRRVRPPVKDEPPGPGRVFAAVLVTIPFIALWVGCFAVSLALGLALMAAGFGFCVAGVYLAGYVFGGRLGFMPDMLLVAGGALGCFAMALLLIWTGLWIAVGGCAGVVRFTGGVYRKILRKRAPRKG